MNLKNKRLNSAFTCGNKQFLIDLLKILKADSIWVRFFYAKVLSKMFNLTCLIGYGKYEYKVLK